MLGNALVYMHVKCGMLGKAQKALEHHSNHNVITWSAIIFGYVQHGQSHDMTRLIVSKECKMRVYHLMLFFFFPKKTLLRIS